MICIDWLPWPASRLSSNPRSACSRSIGNSAQLSMRGEEELVWSFKGGKVEGSGRDRKSLLPPGPGGLERCWFVNTQGAEGHRQSRWGLVLWCSSTTKRTTQNTLLHWLRYVSYFLVKGKNISLAWFTRQKKKKKKNRICGRQGVFPFTTIHDSNYYHLCHHLLRTMWPDRFSFYLFLRSLSHSWKEFLRATPQELRTKWHILLCAVA